MHEQKNKAAIYAVAPEARPICGAGKYGKERRAEDEPQILCGQFAKKYVVFCHTLAEIRNLKKEVHISMFNKKKREIERLNRELDIRRSEYHRVLQQCDYYQKQSETLKSERDAAQERLSSALADRDKLFDENAALTRANGTLKRELDDEAKAKCEFADKIKELAERTMCYEDCKNKFNHNGCRTCVRYPYKKDKYESGGDTK